MHEAPKGAIVGSMPRLFALLSIIISVLVTTSLHAEVYKYVDRSGQTHYVTDPSKIPEAYRAHADAPAELPHIGRYQNLGPRSKTAPGVGTPLYPLVPAQRSSVSKKVEIFVTSWCPYCQKLENFLKERRVQYIRYDIEHDSKGMQLHQQLGGGGVPVTRIGSTVIRGFDTQALLQALGAGG
jgi:glutaredoxin